MESRVVRNAAFGSKGHKGGANGNGNGDGDGDGNETQGIR